MTPRKRKKRLSPHQKLLKENRHLYDAILAMQGGKCPLCDREPKPTDTRKYALDHDHIRLKIRGVLDHRCNRGLKVWMTKEWLLRAAEYVGRTIDEDTLIHGALRDNVDLDIHPKEQA